MTTYSILLASLFILGFGLIIAVVLYERAIKKLEKIEKKEDKSEEETQSKAFEIIKDAHTKAQEILMSATNVKDKNRATFEKELEKVHQKQVEEFMNLFGDAKKDSIDIVKNISKSIEESALLEVEDFKHIMQQETLSSQKVVAQKIEHDYDEVEQQLKQYKKEELKKIEDSIYSLLKKVSEEVIGKTLNMKEHEELVIEALEKAKKELKL